MAGTWETTFTVTDLAKKRIHVTAIRTDGVDIRTYSINTQIDAEDIAGSKTKILEAFKSIYAEDVAKEDSHATLLPGWASQLDAALDAWEVE